MKRDQVLDKLMQQTCTQSPNGQLVKKLILIAWYNYFLINDEPMDKRIPLKDYLFDEERVIIDFSELSDESRNKFNQWFWQNDSNRAHHAFLSSAALTSFRNYPAELALNWWGRIINWLFYKKKSYQWSLAPLELTTDYQLCGIEICYGKKGLLVGLNQFGIPKDRYGKYQPLTSTSTKPILNTKRIMLTDAVVNYLVSLEVDAQNYKAMLNGPHPFAIDIFSREKRFAQMHEHRLVHHFIATEPWYHRLWQWIISWFQSKPKISTNNNGKFNVIFQDDPISLLYNVETNEIVVNEEAPPIDSLTLCGGGVKVFAQLGAKIAFEETGIEPTRFSGSSAGAIMGTLWYLGYNSAEIDDFFQKIKKENIIRYKIDRLGISDTQALKAALDCMIVKKVEEIINQYKIDSTVEGVALLKKIYKNGYISFESLHLLKQAYPQCSIKNKIIVTVTDKFKSESCFFSYENSPDTEVTAATIASASFPIFLKPTPLNRLFNKPFGTSDTMMMKYFSDGGILSNLPTEVFKGGRESFIKSLYNNYLGLVALQYNNGPEKLVIHQFIDHFYDNKLIRMIMNWTYSLLTGVKDPVLAWRNELEKIKTQSMQVILLPTDNISATHFNLTEEEKDKLRKNGYEAAMNYIKPRYNANHHRVECLHKRFANLQALLFYCCYRGRKDMYDIVIQLMQNIGVRVPQIPHASIYFNNEVEHTAQSKKEAKYEESEVSNQDSSDIVDMNLMRAHNKLFLIIHPILLKIPLHWINKKGTWHFLEGKHVNSIATPLICRRYFNCIEGEMHVLLKVFIELLNQIDLERKPLTNEDLQQFNLFNSILNQCDLRADKNNPLNQSSLYGTWSLSRIQIDRVLELSFEQKWNELSQLMRCYKVNAHPLQNFASNETETVYPDIFDATEKSARFF